jgi:hypothetical protein
LWWGLVCIASYWIALDKTGRMELPRFFWLWVRDSIRPWLQERVSAGVKSLNHRKIGLALVFSGSLVLLVQLFFYNREQRRRCIQLRPLDWSGDGGASILDVVIVGAGRAFSFVMFCAV